MSVQQAVVAVQGCLMKMNAAAAAEDDEDGSQFATCTLCERVCTRHLNAFPDRIPPRLHGENRCSSCRWLDEPERVVVVIEEEVEGSSERSTETEFFSQKRLKAFIEAIRRYKDIEEPEQMRVWNQTKESWLKAGVVF